MNLTLRLWQMEEAERMAALANRPEIAANMTDAFPNPFELRNAQIFIEKTQAHTPTQIHAIVLDGKPIGSIGIHPQEDIMRYNGELGYWLAMEYWGKGIMTAAIRLKVEHVFAHFELERIFARPFGRNIGSRKALEKAGFTLEAVIPQVIMKNGQWEDECFYGIRRADRL